MLSGFNQDHQKNADEKVATARRVVPALIKLLAPSSVLDVGCGLGAWLSVFANNGVDDFLGLEGEWIDRDLLMIPNDRYQTADFTAPLDLDRTFDLAVSLEVAEHLPPACAPTFIKSLATGAESVLFSAAIPYQGGRDHVNEQWPQYWCQLFAGQGMVPVDCVRPLLWAADDVSWVYAQNILLFVRPNALAQNPALNAAYLATDPNRLAVVHPKQYLNLVRQFYQLAQSKPASTDDGDHS